MPFFVKTETIKKEYLVNSDLKRKIIIDHVNWIKKLHKLKKERKKNMI